MDLAEARAGQRPFFEDQKKIQDRMEHEQTQLRKIYTERMGELRPTWDADVADSALKNDFIDAASLFAAEEFLSPLGTWIREIKNGGNVKLKDVLDTLGNKNRPIEMQALKENDCSSQDSEESSSSEGEI
ncbi:hypothetical protein FALCPG4_017455 [Fusarium falciforme]